MKRYSTRLRYKNANDKPSLARREGAGWHMGLAFCLRRPPDERLLFDVSKVNLVDLTRWRLACCAMVAGGLGTDDERRAVASFCACPRATSAVATDNVSSASSRRCMPLP